MGGSPPDDAPSDSLPPPIVPSPRPPSMGKHRQQQPGGGGGGATGPSIEQPQQQRDAEGRDLLLKDTVAAVQALYRTILENAAAGSSSAAAAASANLCLRDLCRDTLAFVAAQSGGAAGGGLQLGQEGGDQQQHQHHQRQHPADPVDRVSPPPSPRSGYGETTDERSPLKGPRARGSSTGDGGGTGPPRYSSSSVDALGASGERISSTSRRRSLLGALLPPGATIIGSADQHQAAAAGVIGGDEDAVAPIVDIGAVFGSDSVPEGFTRVSASPYGRRADLNAGAGGHYIYLTLKRDPTRRRPPVVALALIFPDRQEFVPPTFSVVRRRGDPVDFNAGTHGERVYLCFKRGAGNPITDVQVLFPRKKEAVPAGYTLLERTPFKYEADLNAGGASRSTPIFLCYRQQLWSVERVLHPGVTFPHQQLQTHATLTKGSEATRALASSAATAMAQTGCHCRGQADGLPPPLGIRQEGQPSLLLRTVLAPLLAALFAGTADVAAVALRELLNLARRHLGPAPSCAGAGANGEQPLTAWLHASLVEAFCFFLHRAQAEHFDAVVQFLRAVVVSPIGGGGRSISSSIIISSRLQQEGADVPPETLQQVVTACVFLCNFEAFRALEAERHAQQAAAAVAVASVIAATRPPTSRGSLSFATTSMGSTNPPVLGVDCSAFATLRQLIEVCLYRVEAVGEERERASKQQQQQQQQAADRFVSSESGSSSGDSGGMAEEMVRALVLDVVDGAIEYVELTKATQRAVDCIKRGSGASSYESLWRELGAVAGLVTSCAAEENVFLLLAAECKLASEPPRMDGATGELVERDMASKLLALELLALLLKKGGERFQASPLFGCQVRRLVVSALLANVVTGLHDIRVLRRVLALVSLLWRLYRRWCKVECGLLFEEAMLKLLRFVPSLSLIPRQAAAVAELQAWLEAFPSGLVELYLNYDLDRKALAVQQPLSAFEELVATLCSLGEDLGSHLVAHEDDPDTRSLHLRTLAAAAALTRALMNASGHAHLISRDAKVRAIGGGWEPDSVVLASGPGSGVPPPPPGGFLSPVLPSGLAVGDVGGRAVAAPIMVPAPAAQPFLVAGGNAAHQNGEEDEGEDVEMWDEGGGEAAYLLSLGPAAAKGGRGGGGGGPTLAASTSQAIRRRRRLLSSDAPPGVNGPSVSDLGAAAGPSPSPVSLSSHAFPPSTAGGGGSGVMGPPVSPRQAASSVRLRQEQQQRQDETLTQALALYRSKGLKKAVQYLVASGFMSDTPRDVASFLRVYRELLDPGAIGDFLGEGGNAHDAAYWNLVRLSYVRAVAFHNMTLEQALRHFLTRCGFRLPGEAQKIDRLISAFAECYFQDNQGMACCPFSQPDTPYILSYAIIILQTDLHKVGRPGGGGRDKLNKPMSKEAFINNLRGVDESPDLTRQYLSEIYDSIRARPIEVNMNVAPAHALPAVASATGMHHGPGPAAPPMTGGRRMHSGTRRGRGLLNRLFPSVASAALQGHDDGSEAGALGGAGGGGGDGVGGGGLPPHLHHDDPLYQACREMAQSVRDAEELLRGLAVYPSRFLFVGVNAHLTPDLVRLMVERCFFPVHSLCHSVLHNAAQMGDPEAVLLALDIVQYAISAAMFLNLRSQRQAFATLLVRFKANNAAFGSQLGGAGKPGAAAAAAGCGGGAGGGAWAAIEQVHALIADLKDSVQQSRLREELKAVAKRIEARAKLLEGPRRFIREGDLVKKCRSGKSVTYRFFLFSDQLLYCHRGFGGEFKVHQQLLLSLTKVSNVDDRRNCSFQVHHPKKSFVVVAESPEMKRVWMRDINEARAAGRKSTSTEREAQLGVIARLKLESNRVMALLEGKPADESLRPASGRAAGGGGRSGRALGAGASSSIDLSSGLPLRARGAGSNVSVSSEAGGQQASSAGDGEGGGSGANSGQLQDVELELAFADGLRALQRLLRPETEEAGAPQAAVRPASGTPGSGAVVVVDAKALAALIGLFLQYRDGDAAHHDHRHPLAAVAALLSRADDDDDAAGGRDLLPALVAAGQQAWQTHAGLSQTVAMTQFLRVLDSAAPGWREGDLTLLSPLSTPAAEEGTAGGGGNGAAAGKQEKEKPRT